jgi:glycosyltransferase involved in cell wall biosynthesis
MNTLVDFTVAICTYNGEHRITDVLNRLQNQLRTESLTWEIVIVDNNSTDNTAQVVQKYQATWPQVHYYFEEQQGAAFARSRAIQEAHSELIGFLDDDNLPQPDWVAASYVFAQEHPQAGACASQIHPEWEISPPANFRRIAPFLAITERGSLPLLYEPHRKLLPPSAGLVVRRQAWLAVPAECVLTGRTKNQMLTSEDLEVLSYIQRAGWEIWYNPKQELYHKIPRWRLQKEYLIPFFRGIGLSRHVTRTIGVKAWLLPLLIILYAANDLRKIIFHLLKYRQQVKTDLVAGCELQLMLSSLVSPIYIQKYKSSRKNNKISPA